MNVYLRAASDPALQDCQPAPDARVRPKTNPAAPVEQHSNFTNSRSTQ
jgi:hypothetical protein